MLTIPKINKILPMLPAKTSVMLRGDHGIGKSSLVKAAAKKIAAQENIKEYPVIDRRLSTMAAGDLTGLPKLTDRSTQFLPPDWYMMACERPCCLFLDELNRAETELMNGAFQIVLDRELNGHRLHPQTRVYTAVNTSAAYNVMPIDPALLDRFWVADVHFRTQDWLEWAKEEGHIHSFIVDFIFNFESFLRADPTIDPTAVQPSPRSVEFLSDATREMLDAFNKTGNIDENLFIDICKGYVGMEFGTQMMGHLKAPLQFTGEDIIERFDDTKPKLKPRIDILNAALEMVVDYVSTLETINPTQGENLKQFGYLIERDARVTLWQKLAKKSKTRKAFIKEFSEYLKYPLVEGFGVEVGQAGVGQLPNIHGISQQK